MVPQVELFSFIFLGELKTPQRHFEINRPLIPNKIWTFRQILVVFSENMNFSCRRNERRQTL